MLAPSGVRRPSGWEIGRSFTRATIFRTGWPLRRVTVRPERRWFATTSRKRADLGMCSLAGRGTNQMTRTSTRRIVVPDGPEPTVATSDLRRRTLGIEGQRNRTYSIRSPVVVTALPPPVEAAPSGGLALSQSSASSGLPGTVHQLVNLICFVSSRVGVSLRSGLAPTGAVGENVASGGTRRSSSRRWASSSAAAWLASSASLGAIAEAGRTGVATKRIATVASQPPTADPRTRIPTSVHRRLTAVQTVAGSPHRSQATTKTAHEARNQESKTTNKPESKTQNHQKEKKAEPREPPPPTANSNHPHTASLC